MTKLVEEGSSEVMKAARKAAAQAVATKGSMEAMLADLEKKKKVGFQFSVLTGAASSAAVSIERPCSNAPRGCVDRCRGASSASQKKCCGGKVWKELPLCS